MTPNRVSRAPWPTKENKQTRFCLCVFRFENDGLKWSPNFADILGDTDFDFESFLILIPYSQISRLHEFNIDRFLDYQIPDSMLSARGNQSTSLRHFCDSSEPQIGQALFLHVCCRKPYKYWCFRTLVAQHLVNIAVFACVLQKSFNILLFLHHLCRTPCKYCGFCMCVAEHLVNIGVFERLLQNTL